MKCVTCGIYFSYRGMDIHGVCTCIVCGTPYRITCILKDEWRPVVKAYWEAEHSNVSHFTWAK